MSTLASLLHPAYEPGDGSADGAQLVDGEWWHPQFGCESLQFVVDNARQALAPEVAIPGEQWREDDGPVLWWQLPVMDGEQPWVGTPNASPADRSTVGSADPITQRGPMSTPKPRTDAAQTVYEAAHEAWVTKDDPSSIGAATLRAAVDQIDQLIGRSYSPQGAEDRSAVLDAFLEIATELEGVNG
jgi:hypothetical protein